MIKITFSVNAWTAQSPTIQGVDEWRAWSEGKNNLREETTASPKSIPPMLRRRLNPLGKLALSCFESLPEHQADAVVFCSEHGEVERTASLLSAIARHEDMSPTSFSLSVHNAIAGIYSIANNYEKPINAICAGPDSIFTTLIEAYSLLKDNHQQVACLIYDEPLPSMYLPAHQLGQQALAIALLISPSSRKAGSNEFELQGEPLKNTPAHTEQTAYPGEELIKFLLNSDAEMQYTSSGHHWTLKRSS
ncbi:beta-ketoacyl synthase chain length factor [uncultured Pseudoteredinibacter sp.]|uniref:beta-ketoacyl synthase chain length factor n=1 Tax=uncultured Pseudoteredinibacter sp. TaxID=1641701 RepID=UPI0026390264|nr:beta-ketoacyl synthase chain length factor [uncultured Pseudoteredinibacter sp.]